MGDALNGPAELLCSNPMRPTSDPFPLYSVVDCCLKKWSLGFLESASERGYPVTM